MSAYIRILLRYVSMFLITKGILDPEVGTLVATDQDIVVGLELLAGGIISAATEFYYVLAKKYGWKT